MDENKELRILFPSSKIIELRDGHELKQFEIKPFKTKQLIKVLKVFDSKMLNVNSEADLITSLLTTHKEEVLDLLADVVNKTSEWVEDLYIDDLMKLAKTVLEVNVDFFNQFVIPTQKT